MWPPVENHCSIQIESLSVEPCQLYDSSLILNHQCALSFLVMSSLVLSCLALFPTGPMMNLWENSNAVPTHVFMPNLKIMRGGGRLKGEICGGVLVR